MTKTPKNPLIALSMRIIDLPNYPESRDAISHDWLKRIEAWDMTPILIPNTLADPSAYLYRLKPDVLVLTGGEDLGVTPVRDDAETAMFDHALKTNLPVLGVCRGLQLINTHFGGSLIDVNDHVACAHDVSINASWAEFYGSLAKVNSYHTRGVAAAGLAPDLIATAVDGDNHVEAFCHLQKPVAAVMWHPERNSALDGDRLLITGLIENGAFWN